MISIPRTIAKRFGIRPGWKLEWNEGGKPDEIIVKVIPDRGEYGRRLLGRGKGLAHGGNVIQELLMEREAEG